MLIHIKISDFGKEEETGDMDERIIEKDLNHSQRYDTVNTGLTA